MTKQIGVGLPSFWQLPDDHRFYSASVFHDASQDAIDVFLCKKKISDYINDDYPSYYIAIIEQELLTLNTIFRNQAFNQKDAVQLYIGRADKRFKEMCDKLARNWWERLQAKMFYSVVRLYSFGKY